MGKGDKRSRRGKIYKGSYGNKRPHKIRKHVAGAPAAPVAAAAAPAAPAKLGLKR